MSTQLNNGSSHAAAGWQTRTVQEFFAHVAWSGQPIISAVTADTTQGSTAAATVPSMRMTVSEFFRLWPWEGEPNIAAPVATAPIQPNLPTEDDLTLDGFADLF